MPSPPAPDDKPERSWSLSMNMKFMFDEKDKRVKPDHSAATEWWLAFDTPCKTCGTITRRMAPGLKHTIEASCSEACDTPIVAMDGLDDLTQERKSQ